MTQFPFTKEFESISEAIDVFYTSKASADKLKQKNSDLTKLINNNIDRCNKKIAIHSETISESANKDKLRLMGELIIANIYSIQKITKTVRLLNYYSENEEYIDIALDTNLTLQENAQRYFKKFTKAKSSFANAQKQLEESLLELSYFEGVLYLLGSSYSIKETEEIREELIEQGYISSRKLKSRTADKPSQPTHFISSDGFDIFVGRNNKQNDVLTLKSASSVDTWLHTKSIPGSHVIIKSQNKSIPDKTLLEAATLAAYHSKASQSSNVPVDYTIVKNVKKPSGAKPGMVIYENYKTIYVTPDENIIKSLMKS